MPCPLLPPELLDHTIDLLHDERDALRSCSLVSKSWIPRTRKHLFASVKFYTVANLQSWKATFPDPSSSPAYHTQYLSIRCPPIATIINAEEADLISTFSQVVHLEVDMRNRDPGPGQQAVSVISLVQFHGFSSLLKSLSMNSLVLPPSQLLNFITSFPLLEDISLDTFYDALVGEDASDGLPTTIKPSTPPLLTGCLKLAVWQGMDLIAPRLLSLPNNLRFRKLDFTWHCKGDVPLTEALVEDCHSTLEHLMIDDGILDVLPSARVNLDKATELKDAVFLCWSNPRWISMTLRTVTRGHRVLRRIGLGMVSGLDYTGVDITDIHHKIGETAYQEWLELDRLLVQLSESHSIRLEILYNSRVEKDEERERYRMNILLPEVMTRGIAGLVGRRGV